MTFDLTTRSAILDAIPQLRVFAVSLCRDHDRANDLTQETVLRACANIDKFKPGSNMLAWLITILRNQYYSEYRKRHWEVPDSDGAYAASLMVAPEQVDWLEYQDLCIALDDLPRDLRRALTLIAVEGLSYEETAQACNCSIGTIKSRVHRARERLAAKVSYEWKTGNAGVPPAAIAQQAAHASL